MEQLHDAGASDTDSIELQPVDLSVAQIKELSGQWPVEMHAQRSVAGRNA